MALNSEQLSDLMMTRLDTLSQEAGRGALPAAGLEDRRLLFRAISQAVVDHLKHEAEVVVTVPTLNQTATGDIQ